MSPPSVLLRTARQTASISQAALAERLGITQSAVAKLESAAANPTVATLERVLRATGHALQMTATRDTLPEVDRTQIVERLALSPAERLETFVESQRNLAEFIQAARPLDE